MRTLLLLSNLFLHTNAQYIQHWSWSNQPNGAGGQSLWPYWRPDANTQFSPVLQSPAVLEYNCHKMPAICQNAHNWMNDPAKATWPNRLGPNTFTYDMGHNDPRRRRSARRRDKQCPPSWKGTRDAPRCPEVNQPDITPPWYDSQGNPQKALLPPSPSLDDPFDLVIADGRRRPTPGATGWSGLKYSCDEFPPASWIEGGIGYAAPVPEGQGGRGNTFCAPIAFGCTDGGDAPQFRGTGSEQNWQGRIHGDLSQFLRDWANQHNLPVTPDTGIAFQFHTSNVPAARYAARVWHNDGTGVEDSEYPAIPFRRRGKNGPQILAEYVPTENGTMVVMLPNGEVIRLDEPGSGRNLARRAFQMVSDDNLGNILGGSYGNLTGVAPTTLAFDLSDAEPNQELTKRSERRSNDESGTESGSAASNGTDAPDWNITAADVDPSLTTYGLETQQNPEGVIDILELSKQYILGQIGPNSTTSNHSSSNATGMMQNPSNVTGLMQTLVDGPTQCGPGQPCLDGSCCNKDGKCGFKQVHCAPDNCLYNCDAKAMCGIDSLDGKTPCGLKLCCSYYGWCGTEEVHCKDPEPQVGKTPCQEGYGSCEIKPSPSCGTGSGTSKRRRIAYYQGWNTRERKCDTVTPRQINTRGLTHLLYAFAYFHPQTFQMMPMNEADIKLYGEFTQLKRNGLQTWIAVGGWSFNDPNTATEFAFSDMVSSANNRRTFIQSLIKFMETYGFQGADIDWEYPAQSDRGGHAEDTDNLVLLMKEMREQFGGRFGSSLTLAPDYWYLRGFKPVEMQDYVDWMGFMAYDLHGPWDTDVKTLGSVVRPQTDVTEIERNLKPLWFDDVDPAKVVMGIAYYGRTYQLADKSCGKMGCSFKPGQSGAVGSCTNTAGVLSNREIKRIIKDEGITPYFNQTAMVKYFTYQGDSWVGYDDSETYALKEAFADSYCLGGIMIWSIDFDDATGAGLGDPNGYISPENATIIPMAHTTVPPGQTFTVDPGATTDIPRLPFGGDQNKPQGPGADKCEQCSFFRLITSTCCGTGGSTGNPILIPAGIPTPMDIPLPAGFVPPVSFTDPDGNVIPAGQSLPKETIIPAGTVFSQPFLIGPGTPLREGEGEDQNSNSSNWIWLSPEIWQSPNPSAQCYFPCTMVLPPYTNYTTTVDYPRITVTESGTTKTTLTFPPLTVSSWAPTTIVVGGRQPCTDTASGSCTETDHNVRTSSVQTSDTTSWPEVTYTTHGTKTSTRPPPPPDDTDDPHHHRCHWPFCPPHIDINLPHITISWGPPGPTTIECAWPTLTCTPDLPPVTGRPTGTIPVTDNPSGTHPPSLTPTVILPPGEEEDVDEDPENEEEESSWCAARPPQQTSSPGTSQPSEPTEAPPTSRTTTATPTPTWNGPNFDKDVVDCYNSGKKTSRAKLVNAIESFCGQTEGVTLKENENKEGPFQFSDVVVIEGVYVNEGCKWKIDIDWCRAEMRKIIDGCNTGGENGKQGGTIEGDCVNWRIDPNA